MRTQSNQKIMNKYARRLLCLALQGYYFFEDDSIEDTIVKAQKKYRNVSENFHENANVRNFVLSHEAIRTKIGKIAYEMYAPGVEPSEPNLFARYMLDN